MTPAYFNICEPCWNNFYGFCQKHIELIKALELQIRINFREYPPKGLCQVCDLDVNSESKRKKSLFFEYLICDTCLIDFGAFYYEKKALSAALNIPKYLGIHEFNTKKKCQYCNKEAALGHLYVQKTGNEKKKRRILYIAVYAASIIALILVLPLFESPTEIWTEDDLRTSIGIIGGVMVFVMLLRRIAGARTVLISSIAVAFSIAYSSIVVDEILTIVSLIIAVIVLVGLVMVHRL